VKLLDLLPAEEEPVMISYDELVKNLTSKKTPNLPKFCKLVAAPRADRLFVNWCSRRRKDVGKLSTTQLGKLASRYMGVKLAVLKEELLISKANLWNEEQLRLMDEQLLADPVFSIF
jgi:hypothetical protein